jgi:serine/threonine-protein kinase
MIPLNGGSRVSSVDPPFEVSGMASVTFDARGKLIRLRAVPPQVDETRAPWPDPGWDILFREAGLDPKRFTPSSSKWLPPEVFDAHADWEGTFASHPDVPFHVTAAAYHGKPVYFAVIGPWERPARMPVSTQKSGALASNAIAAATLALLLGGLVLARRNLRLGRGDRRGAFRVASFALGANMSGWLLAAHHVADLPGEFSMFAVAAGLAFFTSGSIWLIYVALEPFARRSWPDLLISWSRLLSGRFRDPLVGRDVLVGILVGVATAGAWLLLYGLPAWTNVTGLTPAPPDAFDLGSPSLLAAQILVSFGFGWFVTIAIVADIVLLSALLRRRWLGVAASMLVLTVIGMRGENFGVELPAGLLVSALTVALTVRFGILALYTSLVTAWLLLDCPLTLDFSHWYAGRSLFVLLLVAGAAFGAFWIALGGRPAFGSSPVEEAGPGPAPARA